MISPPKALLAALTGIFAALLATALLPYGANSWLWRGLTAIAVALLTRRLDSPRLSVAIPLSLLGVLLGLFACWPWVNLCLLYGRGGAFAVKAFSLVGLFTLKHVSLRQPAMPG